MSELIDNRAHRIRTLKEVIRHLHEGKAPAEVKARLAALVRECDASEIAAMEQELMAEGVPVQEIMGMCDLHSQVVRDILVEKPSAPPPPGHPVDTFRRENEALRAQAASLRSALATLAPEGTDDEAAIDPAHHLVCRRLFSGLMDVEKHYQRKENLLFSFLERHGITGPSTVMWGKDDEARALLRELGNALAEAGGTAGEWQLVARTVAEPALAAVEEMIFKEERILLPMALQTLTATEWGEIFTESPRFGYCLVDPREGYAPPDAASDVPEAANAEAARSGVAFTPFAAGSRAVPLAIAGAKHPAREESVPDAVRKGRVVLPTGVLSLEQLKAVFATLPVDVTFVDADDRVRFFSEGKDRVVRASEGDPRPARPALPPAGKRRRGGAHRLRLPLRPAGRGRVLDRLQGPLRPHPLLRAARREGALSGDARGDAGPDAGAGTAGRAPPPRVRVAGVTPEPARCPITPATKVAELLESWPELEEALVAQAPAFRRLKNPVLRRTVARVATLEQAAGVGGIAVTIDADALLDAGEVPLPVVNEKARGLGPGELLRIDSGFRPAPLVESLSKQGFRSYVREASPGRFETFVSRG